LKQPALDFRAGGPSSSAKPGLAPGFFHLVANTRTKPINRSLGPMNPEKIKVRTENGQTMEVVVLNKRASGIEIVLGEGIHNVKCTLSPTRNGLAYAGSVMGRELVYQRSREQVQADIDMLNPVLRKSR
jgi:hypothetical protein